VQQLKEFDGKKLKSTTKEGLDIDDEDEFCFPVLSWSQPSRTGASLWGVCAAEGACPHSSAAGVTA